MNLVTFDLSSTNTVNFEKALILSFDEELNRSFFKIFEEKEKIIIIMEP